MNRLFFIFVFLSILLQNFSKIYILLRFEMNQDYIEKNLCIKKDEPDNCCKGKCYLNKQLEEDEEKQKPQTSDNLKEKEDIQYCESVLTTLLGTFELTEIVSEYILTASLGIGISVFRPPKV